MSSFNSTEAMRRNAERETDELIRVAYFQSDEYLPEAVALAKEELRRRGVEGIADERVEVVREEEAAKEKPLALSLKIVCFVLPLIVGIIVALRQNDRGKKLASKQAWISTALGWLTRTAIIIFAIIMAS